jgi:hypothetical protein
MTFRHFIQHIVCVCISFCKPLVAKSHLIGVHLPWNRFHKVIQTNKDVTANSCRCYSKYRVCISFYKPLAARSHLIVIDFLLHWPHRVIQTARDVTKN